MTDHSGINTIIKRLKTIKLEKIPCFFISGKSFSALEETAADLTSAIECNKMLTFKGIRKHFTINMPYFNDYKGERDFINRLKESVSIAKDCYDAFIGVITVKLQEGWSEHGCNSHFQILSEYIRNNSDICFIILAVQNQKAGYSDELYAELSSHTLWIRINSNTPNAEQCADYFENMAKEYGYRVSNDAKLLLVEILKSRDEQNYDNKQAAKQIIQQINIERCMAGNNNKIINTEDFKYISKFLKSANQPKIGFLPER